MTDNKAFSGTQMVVEDARANTTAEMVTRAEFTYFLRTVPYLPDEIISLQRSLFPVPMDSIQRTADLSRPHQNTLANYHSSSGLMDHGFASIFYG
ncbi:hypothetical protein T265_03120 [Opisthorchis viverrini]|uniref:Uncharacterized protein n=1 Tax=Opisthorchis viverrini TaxID=6198 RepID=A0A074ZX52_OPIVI|nr:hypothetical protein T265_03120 [Opisthorchis viverrini]KER30512.1 hypothetical protein T265_03120 [Opisthorchis viverrini]